MYILKGIIERIRKHDTISRDKCYKEYGESNGKCYGICGGDKSTDYLSYSCMNCKYLAYNPIKR
jgi:hypothetical protein